MGRDKVVSHSQSSIVHSDMPTRRPPPYEQLCQKQVNPQSNALLLGDSVIRYIDERKMSSKGFIVQNMVVSGLSVNDLIQWLDTRRPVRHVCHVTFHVGINSCGNINAVVSSNTWLQLIDLLAAKFPQSTLQASTIMPPFGQCHPLFAATAKSNDNLHAACRQADIAIVDHTATFLTRNLAPRQALYRDGDHKHPSDEGTKRLTLNIRYHVAKIF